MPIFHYFGNRLWSFDCQWIHGHIQIHWIVVHSGLKYPCAMGSIETMNDCIDDWICLWKCFNEWIQRVYSYANLCGNGWIRQECIWKWMSPLKWWFYVNEIGVFFEQIRSFAGCYRPTMSCKMDKTPSILVKSLYEWANHSQKLVVILHTPLIGMIPMNKRNDICRYFFQFQFLFCFFSSCLVGGRIEPNIIYSKCISEFTQRYFMVFSPFFLLLFVSL